MKFMIYALTANILGIFSDPFEFEGNYGSEVNPIRQQVFELVVSKEHLAKNLSENELKVLWNQKNDDKANLNQFRFSLIKQAIDEDSFRGPTFSELVPYAIIKTLTEKQSKLQSEHFTIDDLEKIVTFINRYGDQKTFRFLNNSPSDFLSLDKILRDKAANQGTTLNLPILSSVTFLRERNHLDLKVDLLRSLFTEDHLKLTKPCHQLNDSLEQLNSDYLKQFLGKEANNQDLKAFTTPAGQLFFYWLYQALNLHLIAEKEELVEQINKVKEIFAKTLGDQQARAQAFKDKLIAENISVLFTQESDAFVKEQLIKEGNYHLPEQLNLHDGTLIFLKADEWEFNDEAISLDHYSGYQEGRLNLLLARHTPSGNPFLLASGHGHSTRAEDGRQQISLIVEKYHQLAKMPGNENLQLLIGVDANTKTEKDVELFQEHLDSLGLTSTKVGPTTVKRRMVTTQHGKTGRLAMDEEDYIITLAPANGGLFKMSGQNVGFQEGKVDLTKMLPNIENPSDHYPVGVKLLFEKASFSSQLTPSASKGTISMKSKVL